MNESVPPATMNRIVYTNNRHTKRLHIHSIFNVYLSIWCRLTGVTVAYETTTTIISFSVRFHFDRVCERAFVLVLECVGNNNGVILKNRSKIIINFYCAHTR